VRFALVIGADRYTGACVDTGAGATRARESCKTCERVRMQCAVHLECDERERAGAEGNVGCDVGLVRIGGAHDDESTFEIEEIARGQRVVRIDPQRGTRQWIVGETQECPRCEPRQTATTDGDFDPQERCALQLEETLAGYLVRSLMSLGASFGSDDVDGRRDRARKPLDELMTQLRERRRAPVSRRRAITVRFGRGKARYGAHLDRCSA
jgi:hypothetical protein